MLSCRTRRAGSVIFIFDFFRLSTAYVPYRIRNEGIMWKYGHVVLRNVSVRSCHFNRFWAIVWTRNMVMWYTNAIILLIVRVISTGSGPSCGRDSHDVASGHRVRVLQGVGQVQVPQDQHSGKSSTITHWKRMYIPVRKNMLTNLEPLSRVTRHAR